MQHFPILSITIAIPLITALYISLFVTTIDSNKTKLLHPTYIAILGSGFSLICSLYLMAKFDYKSLDLQFEEKYAITSFLKINYHLAIDGLSLLFIVLTALLTFICLFAGLGSIIKKVKEFLICLLLLESLVIATFATVDMLMFYIFFEATLIPMFFIIGIWGGENRVYASLKFFIYTLFGSVLLLASIIYIYLQEGNFDMMQLPDATKLYDISVQKYLWLMMFVAFAIKIPMWPLHTWLPDAHVQAPTSGSVMLAGVLIKIGAYGMLRILLPMFPNVCLEYSYFVVILGVIAIFYTSLVAWAQEDMKKMIAYSSVAHMGYVVIGIFSFSYNGISGAIFQMFSHGIVSAALFLVVGCLYSRMHTKQINSYGGVAKVMPKLAVFFLVFVMSSVGLPGTSGFIGEFLTVMAVTDKHLMLGILSATGVILGAVYMLELYKSIMFGVISSEKVRNLEDLKIYEVLGFLPLLIITIYFGFDSGKIFNITSSPVAKLVSIFN